MNKHKKHQKHPEALGNTEKQTIKQPARRIPLSTRVGAGGDKSYKNYIYGIIIVFTFILYTNTIFNEYALDDAIVITQNEFTKQGISGIKDILSTELFTGFFGVQKNLVSGGRYRPLSLVTFAIEYEFLGQNPHFSHFINILLYALTCILIFIVLSKLLSKYRAKKWWISIPFITTILFIAHPIHTEVVASVKGRDEIFTLLGVFLTLLFTLKYLDLKKTKYLVYSFISFFLALLSKENAITFIAIIPLSVYFFTSHTMKRNLITLIPLLLSTILFLTIRQIILGSPTAEIAKELMNNPFLHATTSDKFATIFYTLGIFIKLLFYPHPLTFDYYPYHISIIGWSDLRSVFSLLIYIALGIYALAGIKKKNIISYGILFYIISFSIVSNLFFPIGTFMSERFMYISSIGFCLIIAYMLVNKLPKFVKNEKAFFAALTGILIIVLSLYSYKTISRNTAWKNDFTLFTTDVKISSNSAKSNTSAGGKLTEEAIKPGNEAKRDEYLELAIQYLTKAVEIHPVYADALLLLGNAYYEYNKDYDTILFYYKKILNQNPNYEKVFKNLSIILGKYDHQSSPEALEHKIKIYEDLYIINPNRYETNYNLGMLYGKFKNDLQKSIFYLEKAIKQNPNSSIAYKDLGVAYGITRNYEKSAQMLLKAAELDPNDAQILINLGITYKGLGNAEKSQYYLEKAKEIESL